MELSLTEVKGMRGDSGNEESDNDFYFNTHRPRSWVHHGKDAILITYLEVTQATEWIHKMDPYQSPPSRPKKMAKLGQCQL